MARNGKRLGFLPGWRIFSYVILIFNLIMLIWVIGGAHAGHTSKGNCGSLDAKTCQDAKDVGTAIGVTALLVLWVIADVILLVLWLVTNRTKRECPVCGHDVKKGRLQCRACGHDFRAGYQQPAYQQPTYQQPTYQQPTYQQPSYPMANGAAQPVWNPTAAQPALAPAATASATVPATVSAAAPFVEQYAGQAPPAQWGPPPAGLARPKPTASRPRPTGRA